jgi:transcriptional regulator with XRE-family HTH domain
MATDLADGPRSCNDLCMTFTQTGEAATEVPRWDTADRMRKALRQADISVQDMAEYLGVARNTVSTWINGRIKPSSQTLRLWALRCGVPLEWLTEGEPESGVRMHGWSRLARRRRRWTDSPFEVLPGGIPAGKPYDRPVPAIVTLRRIA